jgi:hypothetical protein
MKRKLSGSANSSKGDALAFIKTIMRVFITIIVSESDTAVINSIVKSIKFQEGTTALFERSR